MFDFFNFGEEKEYDEFGFDKNGIHKDTKTKYDPEGFDWNLIHKDTNKPYNKYGFNKFAIHYQTGENVDEHGFYISKIHSITNTFYDENGFDIDGINFLTGTKYDEFGYDIDGNKKEDKKEIVLSSSKALISLEDLQKEPKIISQLQKLGKVYVSSDTLNNIKNTNPDFDENGIHYLTKTAYDKFGFDWNGFHKITKTKYDEFGFDKDGIHKDTQTIYNLDGFSREKKYKNNQLFDEDGFDFYGYDKFNFNKELLHQVTNDYIDENGFDYLGLHYKTNDYYNEQGFDREKIHKITKTKYDQDGYDINGLHKVTKTKYDEFGFDKDGWNKDGWNRDKINKITKTKYDIDGYDIDGYDQYGWNRDKIHKISKIEYKKFKFENGWSVEKLPQANNNYIHQITGDIYNPNGFDKYGWNKDNIHIQTQTKYDKDGYDRFGYDKYGFDKNNIHKLTKKLVDPSGFYANGYNKFGFRRDKLHKNGTLYDEKGFDIYGIHKDTKNKYNKYGFDRFGYHINKTKYDRYGFDVNGINRFTKTKFNKRGFDKDKINQFTKTKYDKYGFDIDGIHKDTKTKYDKNGFNIDGIHKDTKTKLDNNKINRDGKKYIFELPSKPNTKIIVEGKNYILPKSGEKIFDINKHSYTLGKLLGKGGEGSVYKILENNFPQEYICKIYNNDKNTNLKREKISKILDLNPDIKDVCFPQIATYNKNGEFIGYIAKRAYGYELSKIIFVPKKLKLKFPNWNRMHLVKISILIIKIIKQLHDFNIIVGDLNPNNILIQTPNKINWIDTDSFQIEEYPCPVGMLEYTRVIHHNKNFSKFLRTKDDDIFALVILLFQIQFQGLHPYAHIGGGSPKENMQKGIFPYPINSNQSYAKVPKGNWRIIWEELLTQNIKQLFYDTFSLNKIYNINDILNIYEEFIMDQKDAKISSEL